MISKLLELIKDALRKMVAYKGISDVIDDTEIYSVSSKLKNAINLWKDIYKDESPWLDDDEGVYSLGLGKLICQLFKAIILSEMSFKVVDPNNTDDEEENEDTRAFFLNEQIKKNMLPNLGDRIELGLATGGIIIKPYVSGNNIFFDYCRQGSFVPISFDDDGRITDIAFVDQFRAGGFIYTKIERQTFAMTSNEEGEQVGTVTVENKAFKAKLDENLDDSNQQELGNEIDLKDVDRWADIEPVVIINDVDRPLFGYYRVPLANNIDLDSPLGISIFSPAVNMIQRTDEQFSRLDWEYEGGQLAIDVDRTALQYTQGYFGTELPTGRMARLKNRLFRSLDLGADDTYNAFAPSLRDSNLLSGLDRYLMVIEDLVGLARGSLSFGLNVDARTATEIKMQKQRTFDTISDNQTSLQMALEDVVYAMNILVDLYELAQDGEYAVNIEWSDSILSDTDTELNQKMQLLAEGVLSKAEVRAWYTGEDLETAQAKIDEISEERSEALIGDLFSKQPETTLE